MAYILKGRQIFSHLEGQESLPAKLYGLAIRQARLRRSGQNIIIGPLDHLPDAFGSDRVDFINKNFPRNDEDDSWRKRESPDLLFEFTGVHSSTLDKQKEGSKGKKDLRIKFKRK